MCWRKWKLGAAVSVGLSLCVAMSGLAAGVKWQGFLAVLGAALVTHFGAYLKDHPTDQITFETETLSKDQTANTKTP